MPKRMAGNSTNARRISMAVLVALSCTWSVRADVAPATGGKMFALAIHGGAGTLSRSEMTPAQEKEYRDGLAAALDAGYAVLGRGASSLDAVIAAVRVLEDNPLFNAGRGAVLNRDGVAELDASLMDGRTLGAGAVTGLQHVKNPIDLARLVMEKSPHVMLVGAGAEEFAKLQGMEMVPNEYFRTPARQRQLERSLRGAIATRERAGGLRHRGCRGTGSARQSRGRHVHRRHDRQALGPGRRFPHRRCGYVCQQRELRGIGHRARRVLHPHRGRPRHLRAGGIPEDSALESGRQRAQRQDEETRWQWRRDRDRPARARSCSSSTAKGCSAAWRPRKAVAKSPFTASGKLLRN